MSDIHSDLLDFRKCFKSFYIHMFSTYPPHKNNIHRYNFLEWIQNTWFYLRRTRFHACCRLVVLWYVYGVRFIGPGRLIPTVLSALSVFVPVYLSWFRCQVSRATGWWHGVPIIAPCGRCTYRQVSNIRRTKSQHLKDSRTVLQLSLPNPLKPDVKSRMKM